MFILAICLFIFFFYFLTNVNSSSLYVYCSFVYMQKDIVYEKENICSGNPVFFMCAGPVLLQDLVFAPEIMF